MMKNCNQSVEINQHPNWPYISDHPCVSELNKKSTTRY